MKKVFALLFGLFLVSTSYGAYQYNEYVGLSSNPEYLSVNKSGNVTLSFESDSMLKWNTLVLTTVTDGVATVSEIGVTGKDVNLGNLKEGSLVTFVFKNSQYTSSLNKFSGLDWGYNSEWPDASGVYVFHNNFGQWGTDQYEQYRFTVGGSDSPAPVGQPLPGALAALLVGGGAVGAFSLRKRMKDKKN
ncbi:hypothetical protein SDC9_138147 [bioreactor metagenome]|uniref:Uncharacterized protein n=1 Tax=bioreactor metagenome TaxID=1076179 RepID=A0A645DRB7_9ZZZZ